MYRAGTKESPCQRQKLLREVAGNGPNDFLIESAETLSNENIPPRIERQVIDRLNHIQYPQPSRFYQTNHCPTRHQLIVIDDNSPQAGSHHTLYHHMSNHSRNDLPSNQDVNEAVFNSDCHLNTSSSTKSREYISSRLEASKYAKNSPQNFRSIPPDSVSTCDIVAFSDHTPFYFTPQAGGSSRVDFEHVAKSRIDLVDLASQELSPACKAYSRNPVKQIYLGDYPRIAEHNHHVRYLNEHQKPHSLAHVPRHSHDNLSYVGIKQGISNQNFISLPDDWVTRAGHSPMHPAN